MLRGGTLIISRRHLPSLTAVSQSQSKSRCQFHCIGVVGSRMGQAQWTKVLRLGSVLHRNLRTSSRASFRFSASVSLRVADGDGSKAALQFGDLSVQLCLVQSLFFGGRRK